MDTPRTRETKKKVNNVVMFPAHKTRKPKTDLAVVIESIKSLLKRDFKQKHPMQTITDAISNLTIPLSYDKKLIIPPCIATLSLTFFSNTDLTSLIISSSLLSIISFFSFQVVGVSILLPDMM